MESRTEYVKPVILFQSVEAKDCIGDETSSWIVFLYIVVYGVEPDMTREGGSIPVTLTFQELTGKNVMLLPVGSGDDGAHSQNEKINKKNYILGVRILVYLQARLSVEGGGGLLSYWF